MEDIENNPKYEKWKAIFEKIFKTANWINEVLEIEPLFITRKVSEVLWGYEDPLYKLVHDLDPTMLPTANFSLMVSTCSVALRLPCLHFSIGQHIYSQTWSTQVHNNPLSLVIC